MNTSCHTSPTTTRATTPAADIVFDESRGVYRIIVDLPGVDEPGLEVRAVDGELEISAGLTTSPCEEPGTMSTTRERSYHRRFRLSDDVDPDTITASLDAGVLMVEISRRKQKQPRKIPVNVVQ